eukprot:10385110-Prorocentrum_lima.AAC.1
MSQAAGISSWSGSGPPVAVGTPINGHSGQSNPCLVRTACEDTLVGLHYTNLDGRLVAAVA